MARIRRTRFVLFLRDDQPFLDLGALLEGAAKPAPLRQIYALSLLTGCESAISDDDLELVLSLPTSDWVNPEEPARGKELALAGVVVSDENEPDVAALRRRDEALQASDWNVYGAAYHLLTRWRDVDLRTLMDSGHPPDELLAPTAEMIREFFEVRGPPPEAFPAVQASRVEELPVVDRDGALYDLLSRRTTIREFDGERQLPLEQLSVLLRYVFGCHGYARVLGHVLTLKKTSPSAGGLHPVEAYPLVVDVEGLASGLYHYSARDHALALVRELPPRDAQDLAAHFVCGQTYLASAHVLVVLAARFGRAFWKYVRHPKGYAAMLLDAAHLSQTLYLVATELGLGAWVTAAVNNAYMDEMLGLDGVDEGALIACGVGVPSGRPSPFDPGFQTFVPRTTALD
jgi:putative peptide maturation dehydrogenase